MIPRKKDLWENLANWLKKRLIVVLSNFFIMHLSKFLGSSLALPANGLGGSRATSLLAAYFSLRNTASNSAEKKGSPSEGVAEGGGWGEEFCHARAEVKRFRRLALSQTSKQNNFQFL
jgi:hypothetical protein